MEPTLTPKQLERFEAKIRKTETCWLWTGAISAGSGGSVKLNGSTWKAYRIAYCLYVGPIPHAQLVRHSCDNPSCVNPAHLLLGSQWDNMQDMKSRGRGRTTPRKGEASNLTKLKEVQVTEILQLLRAGGRTHRQLALQFGVSRPTISLIASGKNWAHLQGSIT